MRASSRGLNPSTLPTQCRVIVTRDFAKFSRLVYATHKQESELNKL